MVDIPYISKYPQDPARLQEIDGVLYVLNTRGRPVFRHDGGPVRSGGRPQCVHKKNGTPYRCTRYAVTGTTVCQVHGAGSPLQGRPGGALLAKAQNPAAALPHDLYKRFERAMQNPDLLSLNHEIGIMDTRITQLAERLPPEAETSVAMEGLLEAAHSIKYARDTSNVELLTHAVDNLISNLGTVEAERQQWNEVLHLMERRAKLTTRETERRKAMRAYLDIEEGWALVHFFIGLVQELVKDQETRNAMGYRIRRFLEGGDSNVVDGVYTESENK